MDEVPSFAERALVGHARGRNLNQSSLNKWVADTWGYVISPLPMVTKLVRGWFLVLLESKQEADTLLQKNWTMAGVPIILRRWTPLFDASQMKLGKEPIWVRLLGLPYELWTPTFFRLFEDYIGEFMDADYSYKHTRDMAMARILVLIDLREGFIEDICLSTKYGEITQTLDYEGVPFRCHRCHSTKHLLAQCDKPFTGRWRKDSSQESHRETEEPIKKAKGVSAAHVPFPTSLVQRQMGAGMIPRSIQIQSTAGRNFEGVDRRDPDRRASMPVDSLLSPSGMLFSTHLNPFISSFLLAGNEVSDPESLLPFHPVSIVHTAHPKAVNCSIPFPMVGIPDPLVALLEADSQSFEDSKVLYALRNKVILAESPMGLGIGTEKDKGRGGYVGGRSRGRQSIVDHARERALYDCAAGTQLTIQKVLRAVDLRSEGV